MVIKYPVPVRRDGAIQAVTLDGVTITQHVNQRVRAGVKSYEDRLDAQRELQRLLNDVA
jgi:hypothetical protein